MTIQHLIYLFFIGLSITSLNLLLLFLKKQKYTKYAIIPKLIVSVCFYIGTYLVSAHLPVYDIFATLQNIILIVILLGFIYNKHPERQGNINVLWFFVLILELFILSQNKDISGDYYMYDKTYVILFFQLRIASMGLFVFAMINLVASLLQKKDISIQDQLIHRARNYTILGSVVFLSGEFWGSYWCFLWWGDPWHWSKGFFVASVMFMLSMLGSHLPFNLANTRQKKAIYSLVTLCLILTSYLLPH